MTISSALFAQSTFFLDFEKDDQGNTLTAGIADITINEPYRNFFSAGVGVRLSTNDPSNFPLNIYDTEGSTLQDDDLERNSTGTGMWEGGNDLNLVVGNALIVNRDTTITTPNDSGLGGDIILNFDISLSQFGFDFIDLDRAANGRITFTDTASGAVQTIEFIEFETGGAFERTGVSFGDRHANQVLNITAADIGLTSFDEVKFSLDSSGGIGTIYATTIPEPSGSLLSLVGFTALVLGGRKRS
ncbi:hypothetical protein [Luteolibacter sp. AS25]|uniref:hypothetical protein n=1 Tax=Luteolibacter sp. AS25 TaxID=3135776 RepID=UPI00398AE565